MALTPSSPILLPVMSRIFKGASSRDWRSPPVVVRYREDWDQVMTLQREKRRLHPQNRPKSEQGERRLLGSVLRAVAGVAGPLRDRRKE